MVEVQQEWLTRVEGKVELEVLGAEETLGVQRGTWVEAVEQVVQTTYDDALDQEVLAVQEEPLMVTVHLDYSIFGIAVTSSALE